MNGLAAYEQAVLVTLGHTPPGWPHAPGVLRDATSQADESQQLSGGDVVRWGVHQWAVLGLGSVCPLTMALLGHRGRVDAEVSAHISRGHRPMVLHHWGRQFLAGLVDDPDGLVANVARLEGLMASSRHPAADLGDAPPPPRRWVWSRDPEAVLATLLTGRDPAGLPVRDGGVVVRWVDGRLRTA